MDDTWPRDNLWPYSVNIEFHILHNKSLWNELDGTHFLWLANTLRCYVLTPPTRVRVSFSADSTTEQMPRTPLLRQVEAAGGSGRLLLFEGGLGSGSVVIYMHDAQRKEQADWGVVEKRLELLVQTGTAVCATVLCLSKQVRMRRCCVCFCLCRP